MARQPDRIERIAHRIVHIAVVAARIAAHIAAVGRIAVAERTAVVARTGLVAGQEPLPVRRRLLPPLSSQPTPRLAEPESAQRALQLALAPRRTERLDFASTQLAFVDTDFDKPLALAFAALAERADD